MHQASLRSVPCISPILIDSSGLFSPILPPSSPLRARLLSSPLGLSPFFSSLFVFSSSAVCYNRTADRVHTVQPE